MYIDGRRLADAETGRFLARGPCGLLIQPVSFNANMQGLKSRPLPQDAHDRSRYLCTPNKKPIKPTAEAFADRTLCGQPRN
jgi:hypothetical protein